MKKFSFLFIFMLASALSSSAQLYYFVKAGTELTSSTKINLVYISGSNCCWASMSASQISSKLYSDSSYWDRKMADQLSSDDEPFEYDSSMSTSKYTVYKAPRRGDSQATWSFGSGFGWTKGTRYGDNYLGLSSDEQTLVFWYQSSNSNEVKGKKYYERIDPSVLNIDQHDFLR